MKNYDLYNLENGDLLKIWVWIDALHFFIVDVET